MSVGSRTPPAAWLGRVPYVRALGFQRARRDYIVAHRTGEAIWMMEHEPVVTVGRRTPGDLSAVPWPVVRTERGGLATYHGPGQLLAALLLDIGARGGGVRRTVHAVEEGITVWLSEIGIFAGRRDGFPGVWVGQRKVAAIGLHFRKGVCMHGFALNLDVDLSHYATFEPCGIPGQAITSVAALGGPRLAPASVAHDVATRVLAALVDTW